MDQINKVKSISIWIFIIPFFAVNTCLVLITQFHGLFPNQEDIIWSTFPYIDGGASISRTARPYPSWLIFKPAMFLTSFLLIKYWLYNKKIIEFFDKDNKYKKKIIYFGIASAIALIVHSIFLGIKFDNDFYKLFRRIIMLSFIIFEIVAQAYLSTLIVVAFISIPIISLPGNNFLGFNLKFFKHALEWDYFLGVISFYMLTYFMWKKN